MKFIAGADRQQIHLLPERVEDYVSADNPVRFLDAFVDTLDLAKAGFALPKEDAQGRGRPGYQPADLLKLYLYGYLRQIRSSRKLEQECRRNLEVIWLLRQLAPDFKTIADFRKDNAPAFKAVARQFVQLCRELELFGGELLAIDGVKIKGQNARDQNWSQGKLDQQLARTEQKLSEYLQALAHADDQGPALERPNAAQLQERIQQLRERKHTIQQRLEELQQSGQSQLSATDPEARGMKGARGHLVGYNVQGAADAKHHLLAVVEVTNAVTDQGQLAPTAQAAQAALPLKSKATVLADGGYYDRQDIKTCQDAGLEPLLPKVKTSPSERAGRYGKEQFTYDAKTDAYQCPAGARLERRHCKEERGHIIFTYENRAACGRCPLKDRCTEAGYRTVSRWEHEESQEKMAARAAESPQTMARRKTIIEHCWGTLHWLLPGGFLVKGLLKTQAEASLAHWAYNLKRALAVLGLEKLLAAIKKRQATAC